MTEPRGTSVSFSTDELVALARRLELAPLPVLGSSPLDELDLATRDRVLDAADRSLVARNVIDATNGSVLPVIRALLEVIARPRVLARVAWRANATLDVRYFAATDDVGVEITPRVYGVHQLQPFATVDLLARILDAGRLEERGAAADAPSFSIDDATLGAVGDAIALGDRELLTKALIACGTSDAAVSALVGDTTARHAIAAIAVLHRPDAKQIDGGEATLIDARTGGLWSVDRDPDGRSNVGPTTLEAVARDLLAMLPT
jgi:hypothetical protein